MRGAKKAPSVVEEFAGARLGDSRRSDRLVKIASVLEEDPSVGFPRAMRSDAELEAFYRFINSDSFSAEAILAPHVEATMARAEEARLVLVLHDTTFAEFPGDALRKGMGITTTRNRQGFLAHCSLLLAQNDATPLGIGHVQTLTRSGDKWRKRGNRAQIEKGDPKRESQRWLTAVQAIEARAKDRFETIHVTDAEGDFFEFMAQMQSAGTRFVVRAGRLNRVLDSPEGKASLRSVIDEIPASFQREIEIGKRRFDRQKKGRNSRRSHPPREARRATVSISATRIRVRLPRYVRAVGEPFEVNVVRVWEQNPPHGETAIEWVLLTTENISSESEIAAVVDIYRKRWVIEDFFKALKTGCSLEKRQVTSYEAMRKVLSLLAPLAFRLLLYRGLERQSSDAPANRLFDEVDLVLLARGQRTPAPPPRTTADALALLARMGGHIRNNGPPGWMTLGAGLEKLLTLKLGWRLSRQIPNEM